MYLWYSLELLNLSLYRPKIQFIPTIPITKLAPHNSNISIIYILDSYENFPADGFSNSYLKIRK